MYIFYTFDNLEILKMECCCITYLRNLWVKKTRKNSGFKILFTLAKSILKNLQTV